MNNKQDKMRLGKQIVAKDWPYQKTIQHRWSGIGPLLGFYHTGAWGYRTTRLHIHPTSLFVTLESPSSLFCTPTCQRQGFPIIFLFIEDSCDIKIGLVAELDIIRTFRALKPFRQLLLCASLTEIAEDGQ